MSAEQIAEYEIVFAACLAALIAAFEAGYE